MGLGAVQDPCDYPALIQIRQKLLAWWRSFDATIGLHQNSNSQNGSEITHS
jgi:hypothetical protein